MWHWAVHALMSVVIVYLLVDFLTLCWSRRMYQILYKLNLFVKGWIIFFDVNGLKNVNDSLGHREGDRLLRMIGRKMFLISKGKCFRFGGDEFVVLTFSPYYFKAERMALKIKEKCDVAYGIALNEQETDRKMYLNKSQKI